MKFFAFFKNFKEKFKSVFSLKNRKNLFLIIGLIFGVLLLLISFFIPTKTKKADNERIEVSISDYSSSIETKLQQMLLEINEVSSASVMVMVESSPKIEYLIEKEEEIKSDEKGSSSTISTTVVFEKNGSVSTPVVVTTIMPKVTGVFIVLNKISPSTKISIINSISVVLNIDAKCISILQEN